ncbi:PGF-CTERM sorting domain-containing protein [Haloferax sp. DFSO60]|uniref:DUF7827 domain-containing protein n=1 Tax=Haloferax sp. DFSO60 TaxID=3388652 RepID=UPI00397AE48F
MALLTTAVAPATASPEPYEFTESAFYGEQGEVVSITLETPDSANNTFDVHIGDENQGFLVHATVVDENDDGTVTLEMNTSTAGQTDPESYLSVAGDDSIRNSSQSTYYLSNLLDAGDYELRTGPIDDPNDTATLVIEENDSAVDPISATPIPKPPEEPEFVDPLYLATPGIDNTATIQVAFDSSRTATLRISANEGESNGTGYNTTVELADGNGDRKATVSIDLTASADATPDEYLSVSNGDRIEDLSWNDSATTITAETDYDLSLSDGNETVDIGTLVVQAKQVPETTGSNASFAESIVHAPLNNNSVANITVEFGPTTERATFTAGSESDGFYSTGQLMDADGDGQVVFLLNLTAPYNSDHFMTVSEGDEVHGFSISRPRNYTESEPDLEYDLELTAGGNVTDIGTLVLSEGLKTTQATATDTTTEATSTTGSDTPGFGPAVAIIALAAVALVATRR